MRKKIEVNVRIRIKSNQSIVKNIDRSIDGGVTVVFIDVNAKPTNQPRSKKKNRWNSDKPLNVY